MLTPNEYWKVQVNKMGRGKELSEVEKVSINAYKECGKSNREIARLINRSSNAIDRYVKQGKIERTRKKHGPREKLSERDKQKIVAAAAQTTKGCRRIRNEVAPISVAGLLWFGQLTVVSEKWAWNSFHIA